MKVKLFKGVIFLDKPNSDAQLHDEEKYETQFPQNTVSKNKLESKDSGYAVNYGRTIGNHHFKQDSTLQSNDNIDHVSEPVNNTYI